MFGRVSNYLPKLLKVSSVVLLKILENMFLQLLVIITLKCIQIFNKKICSHKFFGTLFELSFTLYIYYLEICAVHRTNGDNSREAVCFSFV